MDTSKKRWLGLPFIAMGVALTVIDATIVNVALPSIIDDLGIDSTQAQWTQEIYTLVFASTLLLFGRVADRIGRRRMFDLGVLVFVVASVFAATADGGSALILARLAQGFGGAMMLPTSLSLLNANFFGKDRGIAFAVWGSTIGAAAAFGPLIGGWLTTDFSWRWAFGINIPLGALVLLGVHLLVAESRGEHEQRGVDLIGSVLSVIGIGSIVFGLIEGRNFGWWKSLGDQSLLGFDWTFPLSLVPVMFALGGAVLTMFLAAEVARNRAGKPVLLDLQLLSIPSFRNANFAAAIISLGEFGLLFALPLWLQNVLGYTPFDAGLILMALALGSFLASGAAAPLMKRFGAVGVVRIGIFLEFTGIGVSGLVISPTTEWWMIVGPLFVYGMGVGFATAQLTGVALADVPQAQSGQASGVTSTSRQLGSALGIAILGTVLFTGLSTGVDTRLAELPQYSQEQRTALAVAVNASAGAVIPQLAQAPQTLPAAEAAGAALTDGARMSAFVGAAFLFLGWLATLRLGVRPQRVREESGV